MIKIPKRRNCKICKASFKPQKLTDWGCCPEHQADYAVSVMQKNRERQRKSAEQLRRSERHAERLKLRERKFALSPETKQANEAQAAFNRYIRMRDYGDLCISCGSPMNWSNSGMVKGSAVDAGHYRTVAAAGQLRFNVFNVNGQCIECNRHRSGNQQQYRIRLLEKYGSEIVERLDHDNRIARFTPEYYQRVKKIFTKRANRLKKRKGLG